MLELVRDIRQAFRSLVRQGGGSAVVVLTLAVGIGANTAIFSYLAVFLWPSMEAPRPERLVRLRSSAGEAEPRVLSYPDFLAYHERTESLERLAGWGFLGVTVRRKGDVGTAGESLFAWAQASSGGYFGLFGRRPLHGRLLIPADEAPGAEPAVVLHPRFWRRAFGGDPSVVGEAVELNGVPFTVVGVAPEDFQGQGLVSAVYFPLSLRDRISGLDQMNDPERTFVLALGRLRDGVDPARLEEELQGLARGLDESSPLRGGARRAEIVGVTDPGDATGDSAEYFAAARMLMAAVALFMLLAATNAANLLLARAARRRRELSIHAALGAGLGRLARKLLAESLLLAAAAGALGLVLAHALLPIIESYLSVLPVGMGGWAEGSRLLVPDGRVLGFALALTLAVGLGCGLAPVLAVCRRGLVTGLKADSGGAPEPGRRLGARQVLVVAQVALSVALLLGAGLLARSLAAARGVDPGFEPERLLLATLFVPRQVAQPEAVPRLYQEVLDGVAALPGIEAASLAQLAPLSGWTRQTNLLLGEGAEVPVGYNIVAPGFFETLGMRLLAGRELDGRDVSTSPGAAIVNEALVATLRSRGELAPGERAQGRHLRLPGLRPGTFENNAFENDFFEVVGVVEDTRMTALLEAPEPTVWVSFRQVPHPRLTLLARSAGPAAAAMPPLRRFFQERFPSLAVVDLVPFAAQMRWALAEQRMHAEIGGSFGVLGLVLSAVGVFSVMAYAVSRRVPEMALRMAVGATPGQVAGLVLREAALLVGIGVALGLAGAVLGGRLLAHLLFGVSTADPVTLAAAPLVLALIALLAAYLPARRASRVDPVEALRQG